MDAVHIHLMLNHIPVLLTPLAFVMLMLGLLRKNQTLRTTALNLFVIAAIVAVPVYLTGEPSEEMVETLPGIQESIVEQHEDAGKLGLIGTSVVGLLAVLFLVLHKAKTDFPVKSSLLLLLISAVSSGLLIQTAYIGGQIRHTEIHAGNQPASLNPETTAGERDHDEDQGHDQDRDQDEVRH